MTVRQLSRLTGFGENKVRRLIAAGLSAGHVRMVQVLIPDITGRSTPRPAYILLKGALP